MNEVSYTPVLADRKQEAYRIALALYQQNPDWVTFFREILGIGGVVRRLFPEDKIAAGIRKHRRACRDPVDAGSLAAEE